MIRIRTRVSTNLRPDHNTNNAAIRSYAGGTILEGQAWFVAPEDLYKNGKRYQMKGDKWLIVTHPEPGNMAVIHMGSNVDLPEILLDDTEEPPAPTDDRIVRAVFHWESGKVEELP